jgi:MFS family permease
LSPAPQDPAAAEAVSARIGPILLAPGVRPRHVAAYVILALTAVSFTGFTPLMLPYLASAHLHLPANQLGRVVGSLSGWQSLAIGVLSLVFGALADRVGRRQLLLYAYVAMAGGVALYPLQSSPGGLIGCALLIGSGLGAQLVANQALGIDYPRNQSRGLYLSTMLTIQLIGTAVIVGQIGVRLPGWARNLGAGGDSGLNIAFWCIAAMGLPALLLVLFGLKPDPRRGAGPAGPGLAALTRAAQDFVALLAHARRNSGFQMALLGSMTVRGDLAVVATFLSLSIAAAARSRGIDPAIAATHAGTVYSFVQGGALAGALTMGMLLDRFDRKTLLLTGLGLVSLALLSPLLVRDVMSSQIDVAAVALGLAEGAITVPTSVLLGQEAPVHLRGMATSLFVLLGVLSVAAMSWAGGALFDRFGANGPFVMAAGLNLAILARGLVVVLGRRRAAFESNL